MPKETIPILLFKNDLKLKSTEPDAVFNADPTIKLGVPEDCTIDYGFRLNVRIDNSIVIEYVVLQVLSKAVAPTTGYMTYKLRVSRKIQTA